MHMGSVSAQQQGENRERQVLVQHDVTPSRASTPRPPYSFFLSLHTYIHTVLVLLIARLTRVISSVIVCSGGRINLLHV